MKLKRSLFSRSLALVLVSFVVPTGIGCAAPASDQDDSEVSTGTSESALWGVNRGWPGGRVDVCWDPSTNAFPRQREWVREAFESTWGRVANVSMVDGGDCATYRARNCRTPLGPAYCPVVTVRFADEVANPNVDYIGWNMPGSTMSLNPTFDVWEHDACGGEKVEYCFRAIAAHEFGHALGFAHEQNRSDKAADCTDAPQGQDGESNITAYDPQSIMNYCSLLWNNTGDLSGLDEDGVTKLYGARQVPFAFYERTSSSTMFGSVDTDANYTYRRTTGGFANWSHVASTGNGHFFYFDKTRGEAIVAKVGPAGDSVKRGATLPGFATFSHVLGVGRKNIFFYDQARQAGAISQIADDGTYGFVRVVLAMGSFTDVIGTRNGNVLLFNRWSGAAKVASISQQGEYKLVNDALYLPTGWTNVTNVGANGIFFYDSAHRTAATATIDGEGTYRAQKSMGGFAYHSHITGASNGSIVLYDRYSGVTWFGRVDGSGTYTWRGPQTTAPLYTFITPG